MSTRIGLPRSTVHRILVALEHEDLVAAIGSGRYRLGRALSQLAATERRDVRAVARPFLEDLSTTVRETVDLAVLVQDHVAFIDQVPAPQRLRAVSTVGATFPAYCTANGKALLSELSDEHLLSLLPEHLPALTPNTAPHRRRLLEDISEIRARGYAVDREEHTEGICAVGAVVRDAYDAVAAITIPLPTQRFTGHEPALARELLASCARVSDALGAPSPGR